METKKTGKIIALIVAIVVVVAGVSVGVMAATGVFSSSKKKAFDLLEQIPEKISYSSVNEYIGTSDMSKAMLEKGGQTGFKVSDLTLDSSIAPTGLDLSGFSAELSAKSDKTDNKTSMLASLEKGGSKLSLNLYTDKEKVVLSLPELVSGKVFKLDLASMKDALGSMQAMTTASPEMEEFAEDIEEFFEDEIKKVKDDIDCEKLSGDKNGYKLTIKKESMDTVMNDFVEFLTEHESVVSMVNTYMKTLMYTQVGGTGDFDLIKVVKEVTSKLSQYTQDFSFEVYHVAGKLTGLQATFMAEMIPFKATVDFEGDKENSTVTMKIMAEQNGQEAGVTVIKKDKKADTYENSFSFDVSAAGFSAAAFEVTESVNPSDNSYSLNGSVSAEGNEVGKLKATGSIKDLKQGSYANLVLDDVSVSANGIDYVKMALDIKMGVADGNIEPPQGEEVTVKSGTEVVPYMTEVQTALTKIMSDWGIDPSALAGGYNPLGYSALDGNHSLGGAAS